MNPQDIRRLQAIFHRESRSLLQYLRGASLWAGKDRQLLTLVTRLANEEAACIDRFAEQLDADRITVPTVGAFPAEYTDLNFVAVRSVWPRIQSELRDHLEALETDVRALTDDAAKRAVHGLLETRRRHIQEVDSLKI